MSKKIEGSKREAKSTIFKNSDCSKRRKIINENTDQIEIPELFDLMNSNSSTMDKRINKEIKYSSEKHAELIQNIFNTGTYYFKLLFQISIIFNCETIMTVIMLPI